jgi:O-methyltransferase involved in polyketide biosynthesis
MDDQDAATPVLEPDPVRPNVARVYDYLPGGKDNYAVDRALGDQIIAGVPTVQVGVRAQREVLGRVVRYLVAEQGIRQLIDIGSGLPTADNVHEIAHRIDPATRVVYVDNDPVVLARARALLDDNSATAVAPGDLRDPAGILAEPALRGLLDFDQPIGLLLCGILHYIRDEEQPAELTRTLWQALPPGSYVFVHHLLDSGDPAISSIQEAFQAGMGRGQFRTWERIHSIFAGLKLVEPGLVLVPDWRPDPHTPGAGDYPVLRLACAGVARTG